LNDFKGIGKVLWNLISSVYQSRWDFLSIGKNTKSLREKISAKLTLRIIPTSSHSNKASDKTTPASIKKCHPPFQPNHRKKSSRSLNFSRTSNLLNLSIPHPPSHMYKPQNSLT